MADELARSVELLERLLGDPDLRRRFRNDAASVLVEAGLPELATGIGHGGRALMTLEMRESRSSLAGVMVAAAAEGVDLAQFAEHAAPALAHDAGAAVSHLVQQPHHPAPKPAPAPAPQPPAKPNFDPPAETPSLAQPAPPAPAPAHAAPAPQPAGAPAPATPAGPAQPQGASSAQPAAMQTPSQGARLVVEPSQGRHQAGGAPAGGSGGAPAQPSGGAPAQPSGGAPAQPAGGAAASHPAQGGHGQGAQQPADAAAAAPGTAATDAGPAYPGDTATPQQIAAWMGAHAQRAGLPPELPVMAALTESGLRNLSYGDRDSVGFFQMRVGIWDQGAYAGYPSNPQLQIQWFIDHAVAVKAQYPGLAANPNTWGEMVADVEQPAAQFRFRYQLQLQTAQALLRGADLTSGTAAGSAAAAAAAAPAPAPPPVPVGQAALKVAMHFAGPDRAGASLDAGPTAAELVRYAYAQQGVQLPKVASLQYDVGIPVSDQHLKPGDAVFFSERDGYVDHVGLYVGNGRFLSAAERGGGVRVSSLSDPPFTGRFIGARRYTAEALGNPGSYARPLPTIKR